MSYLTRDDIKEIMLFPTKKMRKQKRDKLLEQNRTKLLKEIKADRFKRDGWSDDEWDILFDDDPDG